MEHLNRRFKSILKGMGANINAESIERAGKSIAAVHTVCQAFEQQTAARQHSDHHPIPSFGNDFTKVLDVLQEERVFTPVTTRKHSYFKFTSGLLEKHSMKEVTKKVDDNLFKL